VRLEERVTDRHVRVKLHEQFHEERAGAECHRKPRRVAQGHATKTLDRQRDKNEARSDGDRQSGRDLRKIRIGSEAFRDQSGQSGREQHHAADGQTGRHSEESDRGAQSRPGSCRPRKGSPWRQRETLRSHHDDVEHDAERARIVRTRHERARRLHRDQHATGPCRPWRNRHTHGGELRLRLMIEHARAIDEDHQRRVVRLMLASAPYPHFDRPCDAPIQSW
jgi:hypothetical protein